MKSLIRRKNQGKFDRLTGEIPVLVEDCLQWLEKHNSKLLYKPILPLLIFQRSFVGVEEEGIFRLSGELVVIEAIHKKYIKGNRYNLLGFYLCLLHIKLIFQQIKAKKPVNLEKLAEGKTHVVTGVLKKFIRGALLLPNKSSSNLLCLQTTELDNPLLTFELYDSFMAAYTSLGSNQI